MTEREKLRRYNKHVPIVEENRYINVKRSMASIKLVITERTNIEKVLLQNNLNSSVDSTASTDTTSTSTTTTTTAPSPIVSRYSAISKNAESK